MRWEPEHADPAVGSFMPYLRWAVEQTADPVLELGAGYFSTPYLADLDREVVTYEYDPEWMRLVIEHCSRPWHRFYRFASRFEDVPERRWGVVLVDCEGWNRLPFLEVLRPRTQVFVVHDSQDPWIPEAVLNSFAYRLDRDVNPRTTLVSDALDVRECL